MFLGRHPVSPYRLYLALEIGMSFLLGLAYATITVYWVSAARLNPLELVSLGTGLELSYFVFQLPTGALADLVSRRLCALAGLFVIGLALIGEGLSVSFGSLLAFQAVLGLGAALNNGAQEAWVADELADQLGDNRMTGVYLRATQLGLIATVGGSLLGGALALVGLPVPLLAGGGSICLLALGAAVVMPERNFRPALGFAAESADAAEVVRRDLTVAVRQARVLLMTQLRATRRAVVAVPGLVLLLGMTAFAGMWSESFDRLWGAFLLRDITFPHLGLHPATWFSLFAAAAAILGLGATEVARRRSERLGPDAAAGGLLALMVAICVAVVAMATATAFGIVVGAYIAVTVLRPVIDPLLSGWMVSRIDPALRATALSAKEMCDSAGQIAGGPVIGLIGTLASLRIALLAGAAALGPAAACVAAARRRIRPRGQDTYAVASDASESG